MKARICFVHSAFLYSKLVAPQFANTRVISSLAPERIRRQRRQPRPGMHFGVEAVGSLQDIFKIPIALGLASFSTVLKQENPNQTML
jgi:hypothetical protein